LRGNGVPKLDRLGKLEACGHDAEYRHAVAVYSCRATDHLWVAAETRLPEAVTDDDGFRLFHLLVARQNGSAESRFNPEHLEESGRNRR